MKKILLILIFSIIKLVASGQTLTASIEDQLVNPGLMEVPILISNFNDIGSISMEFSYDPNVLAFAGFQNSAIAGMMVNGWNDGGIQKVGISWFSTVADGANIPDGVLVEILFNYISQTTDLEFLASCEVVDDAISPNILTVIYTDGNIGPASPVQVSIPDLTNQVAGLVNIPIDVDFSTQSPEGVSSFTFVINYDNTIINYQSIANATLSNMVVDILPGGISISWLNQGTNGSLLNGKLADLVCTYTGGNSAIDFPVNSGFYPAVGNNNGIDLPAVFTNGSISQSSASLAEVVIPAIQNATPGPLNIPLHVDFSMVSEGVSSFTLVIEYESSVLSFGGINNITDPIFNNITVDPVSNGISLSWLNQTPTGSQINDKLLDLSFNYTGGNCLLTFPVAQGLYPAIGDNLGIDVSANYTNGSISQNPASICSVSAQTVTGEIGSIIYVPITVENFNNIGAFDFHFDFDPLALSFIEITDITTLPSGNISYNSSNGALGVTWSTAANGQALNLQSGVLFKLKFNYLSGASDIIFNEALSEVSDIDLNNKNISYENGSVSQAIVYTAAAAIGNITSPLASMASVPVVVNGFTNLGAIELRIVMNTACLSFISIENKHPALTANGQFVSNVLGQNLNISWYSTSTISGATIPPGEKLFDIQVNYIDGAASLSFDTEICDIVDYNFNPIYVNYTNGGVSEQTFTNLHLKLFLEGLWENGQMNKSLDFIAGTGLTDKYEGTIADLVSIELHENTNYSTIIYTASNIELLQDGTANIEIPLNYNGSYYLTIKHQNHLETVSSSPISLANNPASYDFTSNAASAYGNNLVELQTGVYGIYTGDVDQNGVVNVTDRALVDIQIYNLVQGYVDFDVDRNGTMNVTDRAKVDCNIYNNIEKETP